MSPPEEIEEVPVEVVRDGRAIVARGVVYIPPIELYDIPEVFVRGFVPDNGEWAALCSSTNFCMASS